MIDALCHLELFPSLGVAEAACARAVAAGVTDVVSAGTDPEAKEALPAVSGLRIHRAFGIHPQNASDDMLDRRIEALERRLDDGAVALGECGLDGRGGMPPLPMQDRTLRAQLAVARRRNIPVILHLVRGHARALDLLEEEGLLPAGGVWHAFGGPVEAVARGLALGLSFSVGGLVLNAGARRLREALPTIPRDRLLVETDAPHAEGAAIPLHLAAIAELRGEPVDVVAAATTANARRLFRLP